MSEEQHNEETEVEGHAGKVSGARFSANDEPRDEAEAEDEVEGHVSKTSGQRYSGQRYS